MPAFGNSGYPIPNSIVFSKIRMHQMKTAVLWDKDSTLSNTAPRQWMIPEILAGRKTWEDYAEACTDDGPREAPRTLMRMLAPSHLQVVATGAAWSARRQASDWLRKMNFSVDMMMMRPSGNEVENGKLKVQMIRYLEHEGIRTILFVEDNPASAQVIRDLTATPVLLINPEFSAASLEVIKMTSGSI
jgi:hypothetical protein